MENFNRNGSMNENEELSILDKDYQPEDGLIKLEDLQPLLEMEALRKGLEVHLFNNDEVSKYFKTKSKDVAVVLLAKDAESALWNLKNLRKCYSVKI